MLRYLAALPEDAWARTAVRPPVIGRLSVSDYAVLIVGHDGYHCRQVVQWLRTGQAT